LILSLSIIFQGLVIVTCTTSTLGLQKGGEKYLVCLSGM